MRSIRAYFLEFCLILATLPVASQEVSAALPPNPLYCDINSVVVFLRKPTGDTVVRDQIDTDVIEASVQSHLRNGLKNRDDLTIKVFDETKGVGPRVDRIGSNTLYILVRIVAENVEKSESRSGSYIGTVVADGWRPPSTRMQGHWRPMVFRTRQDAKDLNKQIRTQLHRLLNDYVIFFLAVKTPKRPFGTDAGGLCIVN